MGGLIEVRWDLLLCVRQGTAPDGSSPAWSLREPEDGAVALQVILECADIHAVNVTLAAGRERRWLEA